jgi:hypothetical protein
VTHTHIYIYTYIHTHAHRRRELAASFVDDRLPEGVDEDAEDEDEAAKEDEAVEQDGKGAGKRKGKDGSKPAAASTGATSAAAARSTPVLRPATSASGGTKPPPHQPPPQPPASTAAQPPGTVGPAGDGGGGGGGGSVDLMMWDGEPGMAGALEGASLEDEGILLPVGPTREHYSLVGTPYYMSPEMLDRAKYGPPVDHWALGVVAFECFAGTPPFVGDSPQAVFAAIRARRIPWRKLRREEVTQELGPGMGKQLEGLIRALLNPNQHERLGSGPDGAAAIKRHPFFAGVDWRHLSTTDVGFRPAPRTFPVAQPEPGALAAAGHAAGTGAQGAVEVGGQQQRQQQAQLQQQQLQPPLPPYHRRHHRHNRHGNGLDPPLSGSLDGFAGVGAMAAAAAGPTKRRGGGATAAAVGRVGGGGGGLGAGGVGGLLSEEDLEEEGVRSGGENGNGGR